MVVIALSDSQLFVITASPVLVTVLSFNPLSGCVYDVDDVSRSSLSAAAFRMSSRVMEDRSHIVRKIPVGL